MLIILKEVFQTLQGQFPFSQQSLCQFDDERALHFNNLGGSDVSCLKQGLDFVSCTGGQGWGA
tara:strand:- start:109 stop:297 length:189 start_codon:yes stop_codon:yes gene_type:complete